MSRVQLACKVHGPMKYRFKFMWWECLGFDGEGCKLGLITDELAYHAVAIPGVEIIRT